MKIKSTLTVIGLFLIALFLMNNSGGPANVQGQDRTGSPLSTGACGTAGCHDAGAFAPSVSVEVLTGGEAISGYEPGASYQIKVTIDAASGTPASYGFQTVVLDSNNENAGSWNFPNGGQQLIAFASGVEYMEHSTPSTSNTITTTLWDAPAAGAGDVTVYVGAIAANDNGTSGGDGGAITSIVLSEGFMIVDSDDLEEPTGFSVFPNPTQDFIYAKINSQSFGNAQLRILDVTGKVMHTEAFEIQQGENLQQVNTGNLKNGLYLIHLIHEGETITKTFVKI